MSSALAQANPRPIPPFDRHVAGPRQTLGALGLEELEKLRL